MELGLFKVIGKEKTDNGLTIHLKLKWWAKHIILFRALKTYINGK